ncbi:MAG: DegV family protein [Bacilli bacterium]|nr:DegV family protein [Bacilli bacterium]
MNKVKIIVDSTVDLSKELYEKFDMEVIPLGVNFDSENYKDGVTITPDEVYAKVKNGAPLPSTAAVSPQIFEETARKYVEQGYDVIYIGIGSKLSSAFQNYHIGTMDMKDHAFAIDSENLSSGSGLLAMKAAKLRDEGKSAKEIVELVQPLSKKVSAKFVLDTLDYMKKGGRCSAMAALFGHLLHIHPVLKMVEGKLIVEKKPRGPIRMGYKEMLEELKNDLPNIDMDHIMITHAGVNDDDLKYLKDEVSKLVDPSIIRVTRAGCVISSHCGYGTIGILYIKK